MKQDHGNQKQMVRNGKDKTTSMMDSPEKKKRKEMVLVLRKLLFISFALWCLRVLFIVF